MIELVESKERKIYLIGTAHVSQKSIDEVEWAINEHSPDTLCVELCNLRYQNWLDKKRWQELDIVKIFKQKKVGLLIVNLILNSYQKKIGKEVSIVPGSEMFQALKIAQQKDIQTAFVDRDVQITLNRLLSQLSIWEKSKLFSYLLASAFSREENNAKEIDALLEKDVISNLIDDLAQSFPNIKKVIIDERDQIIAENINQTKGTTIIAVVGAGHLKGIKKYLNKQNDITEINAPIKKKKTLSSLLKWIIPLAIFGLIGYGYFNVDKEISYQMAVHWILYNGVLAAIGAVISNAHIVTIFVAFIAAPITSINPFIGAGWVVGFTEALLRKPKVIDFQKLSDDILSFKGIRKNNLTRILAVFVFTSTGSMIGTFLGLFSIVNLL